jgi:hypothetical protein
MSDDERQTALAFFKQFVRVLNDVDDSEADWKNRLGWAWADLAEFAEAMGPDFLDAANIDGRLDWFRERPGWLRPDGR